MRRFRNETLLDCGHESDKFVNVKGYTMCLSCYKESKHRRKPLKEVNEKWA